MTLDTKKLYAERVERIRTTIKIEEPDRVPVLSMIETWAASYAGITIQELVYDYESLITAFEKTMEDFEWDIINPPLGTRPAPVYEVLGSEEFFFAGKSVDSQSSLQHPEAENMTPDEYPEFIADPYKFMVEKHLPRRYKELNKPYPRNNLALAKGAMLFTQYLGTMGTAYQKWADVYGMPIMTGGFTLMPMDVVEDYFRGFKGISLDIKRHPDEVKAACEALTPLMIRLAQVSFAGPPADFPAIFIPLHIATYLRPRDFEAFYWPSFKKVIDYLTGAGYTPFLFMEGNWEPYFDYLKHLPKGKIIGLMENVDMKKTKDAIGDTLCLAGNLPLSLLNYGSKEEVIEYAKKLIDDVAPGGGFIFTTDKALLSPNDGKAENLAAVNKFVMEYGVYKK